MSLISAGQIAAPQPPPCFVPIEKALRDEGTSYHHAHAADFAAALYAFSRAKSVAVLCLAHVIDTMGRDVGDFERGEEDGAADALVVLEVVVTALRA